MLIAAVGVVRPAREERLFLGYRPACVLFVRDRFDAAPRAKGFVPPTLPGGIECRRIWRRRTDTLHVGSSWWPGTGATDAAPGHHAVAVVLQSLRVLQLKKVPAACATVA